VAFRLLDDVELAVVVLAEAAKNVDAAFIRFVPADDDDVALADEIV
jgi:hypothetical protein